MWLENFAKTLKDILTEYEDLLKEGIRSINEGTMKYITT